ncbi:NTP transferase domain-containing protein [Novosphingobium sp.]|uniref:NTP transferase domain-containing protein n=1 Tax=Novosphingobium sp. TaxID=1874826 RepID=UPI003340B9B7
MIPAQIALVLLAAGRGTRFGGAKLAAMLAGKPVARHAADMLLAHPFCAHFAVVSADTPALPGYVPILLDPPGAPQGRSVALGVAAARAAGAAAVMIALADMPLVPPDHIAAMMAAFNGDRLSSLGPDTPLPPVLFGAQHFDALCALTGDRGAGALLRGAPTLPLSTSAALDIDRAEDLARATALLQP